jgi:adenylate cyclase
VAGHNRHRRWYRVPPPTRRWAEQAETRRRRLLKINTEIAAGVNAVFGALHLLTGPTGWWIGGIHLTVAALFALIPLLERYGPLVAPMTFMGIAFVTIFVISYLVGTGTGLRFYLLIVAPVAILILGIEHIFLVVTVTVAAAALAVALEFLVPADKGILPAWVQVLGSTVAITSSALMVLATMWYALREIVRAETAMDAEYARSEALLANILPPSIAKRLKDPGHPVIADRYDDASVLLADIADFTEHASDTPPSELVHFLDLVYSHFDQLVDKHGLEKVKTSGDSYMVVSGVPTPRADHLTALAGFALDMAGAAATMTDPHGHPLRIRIGLAAGPVVAGIIGARRFFYDIWGDAVNTASRMESTNTEGHIQVPQNVYQRLRDDFVFEERGEVDVKGKGAMHTWYLLGRVTQRAGSTASS